MAKKVLSYEKSNASSLPAFKRTIAGRTAGLKKMPKTKSGMGSVKCEDEEIVGAKCCRPDLAIIHVQASEHARPDRTSGFERSAVFSGKKLHIAETKVTLIEKTGEDRKAKQKDCA